MAIDIQPAPQSTATSRENSPSRPTPPADDQRQSARRRWLKRAIAGIAVVAVVGCTAVLIPAFTSPREDGSRLVHTIKRGDLTVSVIEQGSLQSAENTEIKCKVRGQSTVTWVIETGTFVEPGDELVRLDTLALEEAISERTKYAHWSRSAAEQSAATVAAAELAVAEYLEGRYKAELMTLEKDLAISESNLRTAQNMLDHATMMFERGYVSKLDVEDRTFRLAQAVLDVEIKKADIEILEKFQREQELETLQGNLNVGRAQHETNKERATADAKRRDLALEELEYCVIKADRAGMVIYPSAAAWESAPDIEEGATVHKDQVLLLMPDQSKMQVNVGIHESIIDRIRPGMKARVTLPDKTLDAEVSSVATVTRPAGWWTGNVVKYDTIVKLPTAEGLKPGMSAEVEVIIAEHTDVILIPVAAVIETDEGQFCWVKSKGDVQRRKIQLGDSNDSFIICEAGLKEGDQVVLNPLTDIEEAQAQALKPSDEKEQPSSPPVEADRESTGNPAASS